ncbi:hypothetical protein NHQ30_003393 [Ciborinia camelliae]|nr:hypothetical protein NHQ30_003393 [Ciborinia camelliae]
MAYQHPRLILNPFPPEKLSEVQALISRLCHEIRFAKRIEVHEVKGGNKYTIIIFTCIMNNPPPGCEDKPLFCVLRTFKHKYQVTQWRDLNMGRMAAFHNYAYGQFPVPGLLAYDCTYDNPIQCSYIIQQKIEGQNLVEHYRRLERIHIKRGSDLEDYAILGTSLTKHIEHQETSFRFEHYGTFQLIKGMALKSANLSRVLNRIGLPVLPFTRGVSMRANSTAIDFICELLDGQENQLRHPFQEERYRKLVDIASCIKILEDKTHPAHKPEPSVLWHPDFHPRKIIMTQKKVYHRCGFGLDCNSDHSDDPDGGPDNPPSADDEPVRKDLGDVSVVTAILGYDGVLALPLIMSRCPPSFLWETGDLSENERSEVKAKFDSMIEERLPGYCADAYGVMPKITRALGFYALLGVDIMWDELPFDGLMEAWENYVAGK